MSTDFSKIQFNADKHSYFYDGKELTGVTKYLKRFQKPFDQWANAQRVAQRESRTVSSVLAEWEAKGEKSRVLGTAVHQHIQDILKGNHNGQTSFDNFLDLNTKAPEINAFDALWGQLQPKVSYCREHVEFVVGDAELGIAGTVDTMLFSPETGLYHIWDWKTGKFDLTNQWGTLLPPFDYLDDAKFNLYSLQTSLYRLIIERNTGLKLGDSYLVHLSDPSTGYKIHRAVDLRERLLDCLEIPFLA